MKAVDCDYSRGHETLADDALGRHISEMATVWHAEGRVRLGDGRGTVRRLRTLRERMSRFDSAGDHALRWAAQNISQVMAALENCSYPGRLPGVGRTARVRLLAREICAHSELMLGVRRLLTALETFETVEPMEAEEIWALSTALRLELGAAFADVCARVVRSENARIRAGEWAERLAEGAAIDSLGDAVRSDEFYERLVQLLNRRALAGQLEALRAHARARGIDLDEAARRAQSGEALNALLLKNAVETLRTLERIDWRELSCALGSVHIWLMRDPAGVYPRMDFASRQLYIRAVSDVARCAGISQDAVARACVVAASEEEGLHRHVGWHLLDDEGRERFMEALGADTPASRARFKLRARGKHVYMGAIVALAALLLIVLCMLGMPAWLIIPGAASALLLAQALVNRVSTLLIKPRMLPRLELKDGIPDDLRTLVVIPALLAGPGRARELVRQLESMAALEPGNNVDFLLLGDYADSPRAEEPGDTDTAEAARAETDAANARAGRRRFFYLQRRREFNEKHGRYMGRERKRGALMALNRLLLTGESEFEGAAPLCLTGRYAFVITLDADTRVPPGALRRLTGTLGHPLNRFTVEGDDSHGWSVLQPRMELSLSAVTNRFVRVMAGDGGFDCYQSGVSEAYWDVAGEGAYAGKGIYDLRAFDGKLRGALPENSILSHDLLEGMLAGAGYVSDTPLYDGFPQTLSSYLKRLHRWTRGDWQLVRYLGREVRASGDLPVRNPLHMFDRWKVFANLFRSLSAPLGLLTALLALYAGSLSGLALALMPMVVPTLVGRWSLRAFESMAYRLAIWPAEAVCVLDAIVRTLYRVYASGRNMLEWVTAADAETQKPERRMYVNYALATLCLPALWQPVSVVPAVLLAALFALAPIWTRRLERKYARTELSHGDARYMRELARDTWSFFEKHVADSGLPPDNVQIEPPLGASMRTSPTNVGLYMASCVAAQLLGFIDEREELTRLSRTLRSLEKMEKWRGHPYNWVDIQTLEPLRPLYVSTVDSGNLLGCLYLCVSAMEAAAARSCGTDARLSGAQPEPELCEKALGLRVRMLSFIANMDFRVLYDDTRELFHIGINTEQGTLSRSYYDLLGSEARLASFAAMMKGDAPPRHFASLGRTCVRAGRGAALVSWSGTMFEYFMPHLLMEAPRGSLLRQALEGALAEQMRRNPDMPWGVSESGYYGFDAQLNYQYKAFGMPALALSGGDAGVIAPYAVEMAAGFAPTEAAANLRRMQQLGFRGAEGFYEAVDCEAERLPEGAKYRIVKSYMAHHKGMGLLGLTNALEDDALIRLFMDRPEARALSLLLEEKRAGHAARMPEQPARQRRQAHAGEWSRRADSAACPPDVLLMSGPETAALVTADGRGYVRKGGIAVNRWRADEFGGRYGLHVYANVNGQILDMADGRATFEPGAACWKKHESSVNLTLEMCVSPDDGAFMQQATIENASAEPLEADITGFFEVALSTQADDEAHPGFRNLFVQSESPAPGALLFIRRRRSEHDGTPMLLSMISAPDDAVLSCESNRREFMGRAGILHGLERPLGGSVGRVLDPCSALHARIVIPAHSRRSVRLTVCVPDSHAQAADMLEKYAAAGAFDRAAELSRLRARAELEYLSTDASEFFAAQRAAAWLSFADAPRRVGVKPALDMRGLWRLGISGDLPLMVLVLDEGCSMDVAQQALRLCRTLRALGMGCDMAVICDGALDYRRGALDSLRAQAHGEAYILEGNALEPQLRELLCEAAALRFDGAAPIAAQLEALDVVRVQEAKAVWPATARGYSRHELSPLEVQLGNGWGGFDAQGGYVMDITGRPTPAPWVNILANDEFGALIAEDGGGFIWHGSSREGRLTRWRGDTLGAGCEQVIYMRDEQTGQFASLTSAPCGALPVRVRHSPGESSFEGRALDIDYRLAIACDAELPVLYMRVRLTNAGAEERRISLTGFVDWVMGERTSRLTRSFSQGGLAMCAGDMPGVGFAAFVDAAPEICVNMLEFLGAEGNRAAPDGMKRARLSAENGGELPTSPCAALRAQERIAPGGELERTLVIGWARSAENARALLADLHAWGPMRRAGLAAARWEERLGRLQFELPDPALKHMINSWLPYQTQVSRLWARAGFYQPGGAYGFRDQLQDILALLDTDPEQARGHILRCAAHQFQAGDVQHWWHEPYRGVRTRITDDMLFLPYVTALYVEHTGDSAILDEEVPYLRNIDIPEGAEDIYTDCEPSDERDTLRGHCLRAIMRADTRGGHGLPLMGTGDWNDGMNRVGAQGKGESVWLGMFMCEVLRVFAPFSGECMQLLARRDELFAALEKYGWDGQWYRRAYYDDGAPLGSAECEECRIDLLAQAWSALAGLDEHRVSSALDAAWDLLVDQESGLVRLLTPPFDDGKSQPGYIKGYLPGIRENGGQYTHAAVWLMMALMKSGQRRRAWQVLEMLLPPNHSDSPDAAARYAVEPYVLAADVYSVPPYEGRGGWTWYTGSAAWLTYAVREYMLGFRVRAGRLSFAPHVPEYWPEVRVSYAFGSARYNITASRKCRHAEPENIVRGGWIELVDDGEVHEITVPLR